MRPIGKFSPLVLHVTALALGLCSCETPEATPPDDDPEWVSVGSTFNEYHSEVADALEVAGISAFFFSSAGISGIMVAPGDVRRAKTALTLGRSDRPKGWFTLPDEALASSVIYGEADSIYEEGMELLKDRKWEAAARKFTKTVELVSWHQDAYFFRGFCRLEMGQKSSARADMEQAVTLAGAESSRGRYYKRYMVDRFPDEDR